MINQRTQPPWEFLLTASRNTLQSYELSRLAHASNLRKEISSLLDQWLDENANAMVARWLIEQRERSVRAAAAAEAATEPQPTVCLLRRTAILCPITFWPSVSSARTPHAIADEVSLCVRRARTLFSLILPGAPHPGPGWKGVPATLFAMSLVPLALSRPQAASLFLVPIAISSKTPLPLAIPLPAKFCLGPCIFLRGPSFSTGSAIPCRARLPRRAAFP